MAGIVTPEAVVLDFEVAGLGSRLLARLLDTLFEGVLFYALAVGLVAVFAGGGGGTAAVVALLITTFLVVFGYPVLTEVRWQGRSIGKMALGLRVVTVEGGPVRFRHAAIRSMLQLVDFVAPLPGGGVALIAGLCTARTQRLGDLAAGTFVVREHRATNDAAVVSFPPPPGFDGYVRTLDVGTLRPAQYGVIRSYLLRLGQLTPGARARLSQRMAVPLARQLHHSPPTAVTPELFLVCVASAYQLRHGGFIVARPAWPPPPPGAAYPPPRHPAPPPPPPPSRPGGFRPPG